MIVLFFFINGCLHLGGFAKYGTQSLQGFVFTNVKIPYSIDLNNTPTQGKCGDGKVIQIKEPISGQGIYLQYHTNAIGDIAQEHGLKKVYFADLEIFNVLGIWSYRKIYIYGK